MPNGSSISRTTRRFVMAVALCGATSFASLQLAADQPPARRHQQRQPASDVQQQEQQAKQLQEDAESMGAWDQQQLLLDQATDNVFVQQGWNSEPDQYARSLAREINQVPLWQPHQRQEVFLNGLQTRYDLTQDQRVSLDANIRHEAMMVTARHFKDMMPVVMEIVRTRASGEPFTAEQVQRWSAALKPMMDDSLQSVQRVTEKMKGDMTPDQKRRLDADVDALVKRHDDMVKQVERWQAGLWTPEDWGLQDDPLHAAAMAEVRAKEAQKNALVEAAAVKRRLEDGLNLADESDWDKYVKRFCNKYECTDAQRTTAEAILKQSKQEAFGYRAARGEQIVKCEDSIRTATDSRTRQANEAELRRLLTPVEDIFNRLKARLHEQVLTTQQRKRFPDEPAKPSQDGP